MRQKLFTLAAAVSSAVCVVAVVLWPMSLKWETYVMHTSFSPYHSDWYWLNWQIWSQDGFIRWTSTGVEVTTARFESTWDTKPGDWRWKKQPLGKSGPQMGFPSNLRPRWETLTGAFGPAPEVVQSKYVFILLPYWCVLAIAVPLPVLWAIQKRRHARRVRAGHCLSCGYSLRGNTTGICPECGTAVSHDLPRTMS
jgi:hypothetical protein